MAANIAMVGLGVMGSNLARNMERNGFSVAVYNREKDWTEKFIANHGKRADGSAAGFVPTYDFAGLAAALEKPRKIVLLITAGPAVDSVLNALKPHLEPGDIVVDGGNSNFEDTRRRAKEMEAAGFNFVGSGVSGGEEGALNGPSLMPGGPKDAYKHIEPIWTKIAAQVDDGPCCSWIGEDGAGHYVKMVHNGIEYGDMQLIAEAYDLLRSIIAMKNKELADTFDLWNQGVLQSYLIEITAKIFRKIDPDTKQPLVDLILDKAGQKGTGKWTVASGLDLYVPIPTLAAAVDARVLSSMKDLRIEASKQLAAGDLTEFNSDRDDFIHAVMQALYASKICAYAQGMSLIQTAGREYKWSLRLDEIARIWKGGCIIRARFLDSIKEAYRRTPGLKNLLLDKEFSEWVATALPAWRRVVSMAHAYGVAVPAMGASLSYYDSIRQANLPQNLTQAQRDFFGAHTYERIDKPGAGAVHTDWE